MAVPASFNTADRIIRMAMENAGLLQKGEDPSGEDYAEYMPRLNDLVNFWQTQGLKLWLNEMITVPLVAGTLQYVLGPAGAILTTKPMRVVGGYYVNSSGDSYPLNPLSYTDYNLLSNKTDQGAVNSYFIDKQQLNIVVNLWLVPDTTAATGTVQLLTQTSPPNLVSITDAMLFPQEWFIALHWGLADEICTGQPDSVVQRCSQRASMFRAALEDWDVEDASIYLTPSTQIMNRGGSFR